MEDERVRFTPELRKFLDDFSKQKGDLVLTGIKEVPKTKERGGAYGSIIELDYNGTPVVGKLLHNIFFWIDNAGTDGKRKLLEKYFQEITLLSEMKHENIVQFVGLHYRITSPIPVMVMEELESSLADFLENHDKGSLPRPKVIQILLDISKGLKHLHEVKKVAHRDLSSANILLTLELRAKIADFGQARLLDHPQGWDRRTQLSTKPGNPDFMPPEALEKEPHYSVSVDVFSFGCITIHLLTYQWPTPIGKTEDGKPISEYERRKVIIHKNIDDGDRLLPLIKQCLDDEKNDRPTSRNLVIFLSEILINVEGRSIDHGIRDKPKNADVELVSSLKKSSEQESNYSISGVQDSVDYSVVICGPTGMGKSSAANFFFDKTLFEVEEGMLAGTTVSDAKVSTVLHKRIEIIDTPGFFDGLKSPERTFKELSRAFTLARHGVHAVAFTINLKKTFTCLERDSMIQLLQLKDVHPFIFLLFTHADGTGIYKEEVDQYIEENILSNKNCPIILKELIKFAYFRVMMVESCNQVRNVTDYKEHKCKQFIEMIEKISLKGSLKYTCSLFTLTTEIYDNENKRLQSKVEKLNSILQSKNTELLKLHSMCLKGQPQDEVLDVEEKIAQLQSEVTAHKEEHLQIRNTIQNNTEIKVAKAMNMSRVSLQTSFSSFFANVYQRLHQLSRGLAELGGTPTAGNEEASNSETDYEVNELLLRTINDHCIIQ